MLEKVKKIFLSVFIFLVFSNMLFAGNIDTTETLFIFPADNDTTYITARFPVNFDNSLLKNCFPKIQKIDKGKSFISEMKQRDAATTNSLNIETKMYLSAYYKLNNDYESFKKFILAAKDISKSIKDDKTTTKTLEIFLNTARDSEDYYTFLYNAIELYNYNHKSMTALESMAIACYRFKNLRDSEGYCATGLSLDPQNRIFHKTFADILLIKGKPADAVRYLDWQMKNCSRENFRYYECYKYGIHKGCGDGIPYCIHKIYDHEYRYRNNAKIISPEDTTGSSNPEITFLKYVLNLEGYFYFLFLPLLVLLMLRVHFKEKQERTFLNRFFLYIYFCPMLIFELKYGLDINYYLVFNSMFIVTILILVFLNFYKDNYNLERRYTIHSSSKKLLAFFILCLLVLDNRVYYSHIYYNFLFRDNIVPSELYFFRYYSDILEANHLIYFTILALINAALQEFVFRVGLYNLIMKKHSFLLYVVISSILFTLWHPQSLGDPDMMFRYFVRSVFYCFIYRYSKTCIPVIIVHFLHNAFLLFSDYFRYIY